MRRKNRQKSHTGEYSRTVIRPVGSLMDADSGRILFAKNAETERPMASTTKIMTCILALERADPDESVLVSANAAASQSPTWGQWKDRNLSLKVSF